MPRAAVSQFQRPHAACVARSWLIFMEMSLYPPIALWASIEFRRPLLGPVWLAAHSARDRAIGGEHGEHLRDEAARALDVPEAREARVRRARLVHRFLQ